MPSYSDSGANNDTARLRNSPGQAAAYVFGAVSVIAIVSAYVFASPSARRGPISVPLSQPAELAVADPLADARSLGQDLGDGLRDLTPEEAIRANAALPFSREPIEAAAGLKLKDYARTAYESRSETDCLASAIYYEAGFQGETERRAVAQVVLNRVRHPAFPSSVCAVVYQGSDRETGCQFTFTCDGSENRRPEKAAWEAAERLAREALNGRVEPSVGMATHYHAKYVQPYWAPSLTKIAAVGVHIFYRWNGAWGKRMAFNQRPSLEGTVPMIIPAPLLGVDALPSSNLAERPAGTIGADDISDLAVTGRSGSVADGSQSVHLKADDQKGVLIETGRIELAAEAKP